MWPSPGKSKVPRTSGEVGQIIPASAAFRPHCGARVGSFRGRGAGGSGAEALQTLEPQTKHSTRLPHMHPTLDTHTHTHLTGAVEDVAMRCHRGGKPHHNTSSNSGSSHTSCAALRIGETRPCNLALLLDRNSLSMVLSGSSTSMEAKGPTQPFAGGLRGFSCPSHASTETREGRPSRGVLASARVCADGRAYFRKHMRQPGTSSRGCRSWRKRHVWRTSRREWVRSAQTGRRTNYVVLGGHVRPCQVSLALDPFLSPILAMRRRQHPRSTGMAFCRLQAPTEPRGERLPEPENARQCTRPRNAEGERGRRRVMQEEVVCNRGT